MLNNRGRDFLKELRMVIPAERLLVNEAMSRHTTFKIGGPADYLVLPAAIREVEAVLTLVKKYNIPLIVLGNGSNVLVRDGGIRGLVLKFGPAMSYIRRDGTSIVAGAGTMLVSVSRYAAEQNLTGMEFAVGIPGSIGGAVFMNAGAYDGEMSRIVSRITAVDKAGEVIEFSRDDCQFGYRYSIFQANNCTICEVALRLAAGVDTQIKDKMHEYTRKRETKQPLGMPSAGSTFKRPAGHYAGTLIEQTDLKGFRIGGAQVSEKHAGFIINAGDATAQDVLELISEVQRRVNEKFRVKLQPEVRIIGEDIRATGIRKKR